MYERVRAVAADETALAGADPEYARFVQHAYRDARRLGLHLDAAARGRAEELQTRISKLCIDFQQTLGEIDTKLYFTAEQLAGECVWTRPQLLLLLLLMMMLLLR